jgi:hypothetical protein
LLLSLFLDFFAFFALGSLKASLLLRLKVNTTFITALLIYISALVLFAVASAITIIIIAGSIALLPFFFLL